MSAQAAAAPGPVAKVISSGPADFPCLQWLSAEHSFQTPIGSMLYAAPPAERVAQLESALRKVIAAWDGGPTVNMDEVRAALEV